MSRYHSLHLSSRKLLLAARHPVLDLYSVSGDIDGLPADMLLADDGSTLPYIRNHIFPNGSTVSRKGHITPIRASRLSASGADIVVVGVNSLYSGMYSSNGFHLVPKWLGLYLPLDKHPDELISELSESRRQDIRRNIRLAQKRGFTCDTTTDPDWFDRFYHEMYLPYANNRHGELKTIAPYRKIKKAFSHGLGIVVTRCGEPVGGAVVTFEKDVMHNYSMGIYNGDEALAREGVSVSLYYHSMLFAHARGCKGINFGSTRPFLSDGVLQYKLKWGMKVVDNGLCTSLFAIHFPNRTPAADAFINKNPFFELCDDEIRKVAIANL